VHAAQQVATIQALLRSRWQKLMRIAASAGQEQVRGSLFRKYVTLFIGIVCFTQFTNGLFEFWLSYREHKSALIRVQQEQAQAAAAKIDQFVREIESQVGWTTQLPWSAGTIDQRYSDGLRLLRQVPAITELSLLDSLGRERVRVSRLAMDVIGSQINFSNDKKFSEAVAKGVYYGPVYFRRESEPYMTLALAGRRQDSGVSVAEVNLTLIWDVVSQIKVGNRGQAFVVDSHGRLIAHPEINLVLRNTDLSRLPQVRAALATGSGAASESEQIYVAEGVQGRLVLTAHAPVAPLGWLVFAELPIDEAFGPLYVSLARTGLLLLGNIILAVLSSFLLARKMVSPIRALQTGAAQIGAGALDHRIEVSTGDELEALGRQFNSMAARLQESYANLERKVGERTHQLELANHAKSRFLAAASHDLRQPLHALGLFIAQLRAGISPSERDQVIARIDAAIAAVNELLNSMLDISKLDAGVMAPNLADFPVENLLKRIEGTFGEATREKRLRMRVVSSEFWVRSDFILLERILLNLVSNAVRYTIRGGIVIGCRKRGTDLRIEVWDSGIGIPEDQQGNIFAEFYQLVTPASQGGLGLGLAIVDRLCALLGHHVEVASVIGKGSRFTVVVPITTARTRLVEFADSQASVADGARGKFVVVVDDDTLVLDGMRGLLESWGCVVLTGASESALLASLAEQDDRPDLIISDYRLSDGKTGIEVIEGLRSAFGAGIPGFLISGDTSPEPLRKASIRGYILLHKPVRPVTLRAILSHLLTDRKSWAGTGT
jgi:signal transduction histidine kinase/CheY-like chemotaxis protein